MVVLMLIVLNFRHALWSWSLFVKSVLYYFWWLMSLFSRCACSVCFGIFYG